MNVDGDPGDLPPPEAAALAELDSDTWAWLLPHLRAALEALPEEARTPEIERVRTASTGQLAGGPRRRELCRLVAGGGILWSEVRDRVARSEGIPASLRALVAIDHAGTGVAAGAPNVDEEDRSSSTTGSSGELDRLRDRLRVTREERDTWRRKARGERARADALERRLQESESARDRIERERERFAAELAAAAKERARAVEREERRREGQLRALREQIAQLRRADEDRKALARRAAEEQRRAERAAAEAERAGRTSRAQPAARIVPGRPTELPPGVAPATTEAARLLLHRGRLVLVDGYNVTLRHQGRLDLETQRTWLVQLAATLAARRGIRPVIVFDGERSGGRPPTAPRDVEVRFTPAGVTADDEIVLAVEGTDEPVVVVTDDRELIARVRMGGADVIATGQLLGVAS